MKLVFDLGTMVSHKTFETKSGEVREVVVFSDGKSDIELSSTTVSFQDLMRSWPMSAEIEIEASRYNGKQYLNVLSASFKNIVPVPEKYKNGD